MALKASVKTTGGHKIKALLKNAQRSRRKSIKVGFFSDSKYPDGKPVAAVAAINEFGLGSQLERPFFRQSVGDMTKDLSGEVAKAIDPKTMTIDADTAKQIGDKAVDMVRKRIKGFGSPENRPSTLEGKEGSQPLIDTKKMLNAVKHDG